MLKCIECDDEQEEWGEEWGEPYYIDGVCFFCRIENVNKKAPKKVIMKIDRYYMHISKKATIYDLKCPECGFEVRELVKNEKLPFCKKCDSAG